MTSDLPIHLASRASRGLTQRALSNVGMGSLPNLSIKDNRFTLVDPVKGRISIETLYVDVVIVDINEHVSKAYFDPDNPYAANSASPPICFSDNGKAPSVSASAPQNALCASCPQNVWGSKISGLGSEVKACEDLQKIAVYVPAYSDGLYLMRIKGGSFKNWRAYLAQYQKAGIDPDRRITRVEFVGQGILKFSSPDYTTPEMEAVVAQMVDANAGDMLVGRLDRPRTEALPKPEMPQNPLLAQSAVAPPPSAAPSTPWGSSTSPASAAEPAKRPLSPPFAPSVEPPSTPTSPTHAPLAEMIASGLNEKLLSERLNTQAPKRPRGRPRATPQAPAQTPPAAAAAPSFNQPVATAPFRVDPPPTTGIVTNAPSPPAGLDLDEFFKKEG